MPTQYASNYTRSPSKSVLLDTSCRLGCSLCAHFITARFCAFFFFSPALQRDVHLNIFSNIEAYSFMSCSMTGSKTQGLYVCLPRLPKTQLLRGPLIINRCTLSRDKRLTSKGWDVSQQELKHLKCDTVKYPSLLCAFMIHVITWNAWLWLFSYSLLLATPTGLLEQTEECKSASTCR